MLLSFFVRFYGCQSREHCLSKEKHIWELKFFSSNGISQSTSEFGRFLENFQIYLLFNKTTDFEYYSKCEYVHVETNSHNEDAAILAFSMMFLLGLGTIKPQESLCLLSVCPGTCLG